MAGTIDATKLKTAINRQIHPMARCVALLRKTDKIVGSLNLQVAVSEQGAVTPSLQSPANAEATKCVVEGARAWKLPSVGSGTAMVLLNLEEGSGPSLDEHACSRDDECTVAPYPSCCSCAEDASPRAMHKETLRKHNAMCATIDCKPCDHERASKSPPSPEREPTPKGAACRAARCVAVY